MQSSYAAIPPANNHRSHASLSKFTSTPRDSPHSSRRHLHGLREHRHHHSRSAKEKLHSALDAHPPASFTDLARQVTKSLDDTPTSSQESRRGSLNNADEDALIARKTRLVRPEDARREHIRNQVREEELRSSLQELTGVAMSTTRQLDDTYYSILEHISNLRNTIGGLLELSKLTKQLQSNFDGDAEELEKDTKGQIEAFGGFRDAQGKIEEFEERIGVSREKARGLSERLDAARRRVEIREKKDAQWQAKASRRLRILWGLLGSLVGIFVLLLVFHYVWAPAEGRMFAKPLRGNHTIDLEKVTVPPPVKEILRSIHEPPSSRRTWELPTSSPESVGKDPKLRVLDEL